MQLPSLVLALAAVGTLPDNVLLDFTASWCGPCQQMSPVVAALQRQGYPIRKVDVDREPNLARQFGVRSIPTFVLVANGREVRRMQGVTSQDRLLNLLAQLPKPPASAPADASSGERSRSPQSTPKSKFPFSLFARNDDEEGEERELATAEATQPVIRAKLDNEAGAENSSPAIDPVRATVRLRVNESDGVNFGSGTVIESRPGRTIILTCGHIFRNEGKDSPVEVDVFIGQRHETYVGTVLLYDLEADVGLCAIPTEGVLPVARVAAAESADVGQPVTSMGCSAGKTPTGQQLTITALNRYLGPDNVECTGVPMQGRSGGGLFNQQGELIGVCIAADQQESRGLYAGLKPIHQLLDRSELAEIHRSGRSSPGSTGTQDSAESEFAAAGADAFDRQFTTGASRDQLTLVAASQTGRGIAGSVSGSEPAQLEGAGEAEVVCILRPLNQPRAPSRVVIIHRASPKFVSFLTRELEAQPKPTMHTVRHDQPAEARGTSVSDNQHVRLPRPTRLTSAESPAPTSRGTSQSPHIRTVEQYRRSSASR